jgi:hypothetical protein
VILDTCSRIYCQPAFCSAGVAPELRVFLLCAL